MAVCYYDVVLRSDKEDSIFGWDEYCLDRGDVTIYLF